MYSSILILLPALVLATRTSGGRSEAWPWAWPRTSGRAPSPRQGHAAVEVGRRVYVLGGCDQEGRCFNDVAIYDTESSAWLQESFVGEAPEPRGGHSASMLRMDVFVVGGASMAETFGDVHRLDLAKRRWARLETEGRAITRRTNHAAAVEKRGDVVVFGGYSPDGSVLNDLWLLKGAAQAGPVRWRELKPAGAAPLARQGHSLTFVDDRLVLFGGYAACGKVLNDVHIYDIEAQSWGSFEVVGAAPLPRQAHSAVRHGRSVVVAGGCDVSEGQPHCFGDVWSLDLIQREWTLRTQQDARWSAREGHSATYVRGEMFLFGGCQVGAACFNDVSVLDSSDPCPSACGGHGQCMAAQFCRCTMPGFTGHDCMQPLTCAMDCGPHGSCGQNGHCACENGWAGPDCSVEIPCPGQPSKCSGRGLCLPNGACQCYANFDGVDCSLNAVTCPLSCSGRGECMANGQCACHQGWQGPACTHKISLLQLECPSGCCGHGQCHAGGCNCSLGWYGEACDINATEYSVAQERQRERLVALAILKRRRARKAGSLVQVRRLLAQADNLERRAVGAVVPRKEDLAAAEKVSCEVQKKAVLVQHRKKIYHAPLPKKKDFGIGDTADPDAEEDESMACAENCNFRGLCDQGVCYCQPGHYGETCDETEEADEDSVSFGFVMTLAAICLTLSFAVLLTMLCIRKMGENSFESKMGYDTRGIV